RGELVALVLLRDLLGAAAELGTLATLVQVLGKRAQRRARDQLVRAGALGGLGHRPVHCGSRFSKNAFTPSTMSSVDSAIVSCACRYSSASRKAMSICRNIASLPMRMISGDLPASF